MEEDNLKSIEEIENDVWEIPKQPSSSLVIRCTKLRKLPIRDLETEDLRVLIGQEIGINILIPLALSVLKDDPVAEGDYYEGDLLMSILSVEAEYWQNNNNHYQELKSIYPKAIELLEELSSMNIKERLEQSYHRLLAEMG